MPFELKVKNVTQYRCDNCGRIIRENPIVIKTCCVNKPWVFCSTQCLGQFTSKWMKNQDAMKSGGRLRSTI